MVKFLHVFLLLAIPPSTWCLCEILDPDTTMSDERILRLVEPDETLPSYTGELTLSAPQLQLYESDALITLGIAGIRGGKTHVGAFKSLDYALAHPCGEDEFHAVGSPTYQMSKVPIEKMFRLLYDKTLFPICPLVKFVKSERTFILACEDGRTTKIIIRSLHDPDRWRGLKLLSGWLDEGAYISKYAWDIVQGRLADSNGPCWITTTPAGYNWVFDLYDDARHGNKDIRVIHWPSTANIFASQIGLAGLIGRFDPRTYQQEVQGKFVRGSGIVYYTFQRTHHLKPGKFDKNKPLYVGQDFNVNPMCSVFSQPFTTQDGHEGAHVLWSRRVENSDTFALVNYLDQFCRSNFYPKSKVIIYADAAGKARSTAGKSDFRILRESGYRVDAPASNPLIKDRVNCVNGLFAPIESRFPRLLVDPECREFIQGLEKQVWDPESDPPVPDKTMGYDHMNDGFGYMCWRRWPLKARTTLPGRRAA